MSAMTSLPRHRLQPTHVHSVRQMSCWLSPGLTFASATALPGVFIVSHAVVSAIAAKAPRRCTSRQERDTAFHGQRVTRGLSRAKATTSPRCRAQAASTCCKLKRLAVAPSTSCCSSRHESGFSRLSTNELKPWYAGGQSVHFARQMSHGKSLANRALSLRRETASGAVGQLNGRTLSLSAFNIEVASRSGARRCTTSPARNIHPLAWAHTSSTSHLHRKPQRCTATRGGELLGGGYTRRSRKLKSPMRSMRNKVRITPAPSHAAALATGLVQHDDCTRADGFAPPRPRRRCWLSAALFTAARRSQVIAWRQ
jgi:hypothetical protein